MATKAKQPLVKEHREHLKSELGDKGVKLAVQYGARSVSEEEAKSLGFRVRGKDKQIHYTSGLLLPFADNFSQLRCDKELFNSAGDPVKYLSPAGKKLKTVVFGEGQPKFATEGWKDALAIYINTGETCAAIAGVHSWKLLPETVEVIIYDADAVQNYQVWGALIDAGLNRKGLRLAFFPRELVGPKGGACEFFNKNGKMEDLTFHRPKDLLEKLPSLIDKDLKTNWLMPTLIKLGELGLKAYNNDRLAAEKLIKKASTRLKISKRNQDIALARATKRARTKKNDSSNSQDRPQNTPSTESLAIATTDSAEVIDIEEKPAKEIKTKADLQEFLLRHYEIRYNELTRMVELDGREFQELDLADSWLADVHGIEIAKQSARDSLLLLAQKNKYNPIKEYLESVYNNRSNLKLLAIAEISKAFGIAHDDELSQEMLARHLIGVARRGLEPGYKHDQILVLTSAQGCGKGQTIAELVPKREWADSATKVPKSLEDREFLAKANGCWIFELDEIDKITIGRDAAEMKGFITRQIDKYVEKYQTVVLSYPRRSVLFGTSNQQELLNDHTGDRRFWIVRCGKCNPAWVRENRDSIWATVLTWLQWRGSNWVPQEHALAKSAAERAREARISEPLEKVIRKALENIHPIENGVSLYQIMKIILETETAKEFDRTMQMRITRTITGDGFTTAKA